MTPAHLATVNAISAQIVGQLMFRSSQIYGNIRSMVSTQVSGDVDRTVGLLSDQVHGQVSFQAGRAILAEAVRRFGT